LRNCKPGKKKTRRRGGVDADMFEGFLAREMGDARHAAAAILGNAD